MIPANVLVTASKSGWMTRKTMAFWIRRVWGNPEDDVRRLLVLDEFAQPLDEFAQPLDEFAQPLDVSINKPFKSNMRHLWERWAFDNLKPGLH